MLFKYLFYYDSNKNLYIYLNPFIQFIKYIEENNNSIDPIISFNQEIVNEINIYNSSNLQISIIREDDIENYNIKVDELDLYYDQLSKKEFDIKSYIKIIETQINIITRFYKSNEYEKIFDKINIKFDNINLYKGTPQYLNDVDFNNFHILILNHSKSGTTSLWNAFEELYGTSNVLTFHDIILFNSKYPEFSKYYIYFKQILNYVLKYRKIKVITVYRDPFLRSISALYNQTVYNLGEKNISEEKILDYFHKMQFFPTNGAFRSLLELNINFYEHPFDKNKGYLNYQQNNLDIFVIRFDKLNHLNYLFHGLKLIHVNKTSDLPKSGIIYKNIKHKLVLSTERLEYIKKEEDKNLNYFYDKIDIDKMLITHCNI